MHGINEAYKILNTDIVKVQKLTGGVSNETYRLSADDKSIIMKVYHDNPTVDREAVIVIQDILSYNNLCPRIIDTYTWGHFEEFQEGRVLSIQDLNNKDILKKIANAMRKMHRLQIRPAAIRVQKNIQKWSTILNHGTFNFNNTCNLKTGIIHGHLNPGNMILYQGVIKFIDLEYAGFGYCLYDIANLFNEFCGNELNWNNFPSNETITYFFNCYGMKRVNISNFIQMSHIHWYLWGIWMHESTKNKKNDTMKQFNYLNYAKKRHNRIKSLSTLTS